MSCVVEPEINSGRPFQNVKIDLNFLDKTQTDIIFVSDNYGNRKKQLENIVCSFTCGVCLVNNV